MPLEIVAGMQIDNEKATAANAKAIATLTDLANIAGAHEERLERLEYQQ